MAIEETGSGGLVVVVLHTEQLSRVSPYGGAG